MSGFEALGAAAAIIQLTETAVKYGRKAVEVYETKTGLDRNLRSLEQLTEEFQIRNRALIETRLSDKLGQDDKKLLDICIRCEESAAHLASVIDQVRMKDRTKWKSLVSAWKHESKRDEIVHWQTELSRWRQECLEHMQKMMLEEQYGLARALKEISLRQENSMTAFSAQLMALRREMLGMLRDTTNREKPGLAGMLLEAQKTGGSLLPRDDILNSLLFDEIELRWDGIARPTESTYAWMFSRDDNGGDPARPPVRYVQWLEKDTDLFWVTGRAGSGKSTLMKFIRQHPVTKASLRKWAKGRDLFVADFYFWYRGDSLQRTHIGLLRSILYKILDQCPDLIEHVCRERWMQATSGRNTRQMPWTLTMLQECADVLTQTTLKANGQEICFCFFIDGLDETSDRAEDVVRTLKRLAAAPNIKICASSRPWNQFEVDFRDASERGDSIEVHEHTKSDVEIVVRDELNSVPNDLVRKVKDLEPLISKIVDMSNGVFLWVILVLRRELVPMIRDEENIESLHKKLLEIPDDLILYFDDIFKRVWEKTHFREQTARIFRTCINATQPVPLACLEVMVEDDPEEYVCQHNSPLVFNSDRIKAATSQVKARCLDLLSVEATTRVKDAHPFMDYRIHFLHRTVADFLVENEVARDLEKYSGSDFNANTTLFACHAFLVKKHSALGSELGRWWRAMNWSTASLLYCPRISGRQNTTQIIDDIDESMEQVFKDRPSIHATNVHWTEHMVSLDRLDQSLKIFAEHTGRDLIGHLIEFGIIGYVRDRLTSAPELLKQKRGRPYLDYALRQDMEAGFRYTNPEHFGEKIKYHVELIQTLLSLGCDVNHRVGIYDARTVWDLYLAFLYENQDYIDHNTALEATQLLVRAGAKDVPRCVLSKGFVDPTAKFREKASRSAEVSMQKILEHVFGSVQGRQLVIEVKKNSSTSWLSGILGWK